MSEKDFWEEFLKKNLANRTEIFGGNNPLFIPYATDEKDYEDRYIHNAAQLLYTPNPLVAEAEASDSKPLIDVDFMRNLQTGEFTGNGYGVYQSEQEIAAELERLEQMTDDLRNLK